MDEQSHRFCQRHTRHPEIEYDLIVNARIVNFGDNVVLFPNKMMAIPINFNFPSVSSTSFYVTDRSAEAQSELVVISTLMVQSSMFAPCVQVINVGTCPIQLSDGDIICAVHLHKQENKVKVLEHIRLFANPNVTDISTEESAVSSVSSKSPPSLHSSRVNEPEMRNTNKDDNTSDTEDDTFRVPILSSEELKEIMEKNGKRLSSADNKMKFKKVMELLQHNSASGTLRGSMLTGKPSQTARDILEKYPDGELRLGYLSFFRNVNSSSREDPLPCLLTELRYFTLTLNYVFNKLVY